MASGSENLRVEDDGLICPEVRRWAETKFRLIALYDELFSTGMKNKWEQRVYIDLYAGAGYGHIQGTRSFLKGSPVIALTVSCPFDKYIFCEESKELLDALKARAQRIAPRVDVTYIQGKCDSEIGRICAAIPKASSRSRVLMRIPMMSISHSDLMPIRSERSDAGLSQCETVIGMRQEFCWFSLS